MKKTLLIAFLTTATFLYCKHSENLSEQLKSNFTTHLKKVDSSLVLDSFRIIGIDTINQRLGTIIDDTVYKRSLYRVQLQLANAVKEQKKDSIRFYQEEINYMLPQIDSLTNSIPKADTKKKFGIVIRCLYQVRKNSEYQKTFILYFLDNKMNVLNSDMIDSIIHRSYVKLK